MSKAAWGIISRLASGRRGLRLPATAILVFAGLLAAPGGLRAQQTVMVDVMMEQDEFVAGEAVVVSVRIINYSGQTLHFGKENWLSFLVEKADGNIVARTAEPQSDHDFELLSGQQATQRANLEPCYAIEVRGSYRVTATVSVRDLGQDVSSTPKNFTIIQGFKIWEQEFGMPAIAGGSGSSETRKYTLVQATYPSNKVLYLRLTDPSESRVFRVLRLGTETSFAREKMQLDKHTTLHVLFEEGARTFNYSAVGTDGELKLRQTYLYTETPPRLVIDDKGEVAVKGGKRNIVQSDFPPPAKSLTSSNSPPPPAPAPSPPPSKK